MKRTSCNCEVPSGVPGHACMMPSRRSSRRLDNIFLAIIQQAEENHNLKICTILYGNANPETPTAQQWVEYPIAPNHRLRLTYDPQEAEIAVRTSYMGRTVIRDFSLQHPDSLQEIQNEIRLRIFAAKRKAALDEIAAKPLNWQ